MDVTHLASNLTFFFPFAWIQQYNGKDFGFASGSQLFIKKDFKSSVVFLKVCMKTRVCLAY